jgi:hypothetical protein
MFSVWPLFLALLAYPPPTMWRVYKKCIMTGCYSFEVLIGLQGADLSTDNNQSAQRREKKQKHQHGTQIGYNLSSLKAL